MMMFLGGLLIGFIIGITVIAVIACVMAAGGDSSGQPKSNSCPYCDFSESDVSERIITNGDPFVMIKAGEQEFTLCTDDRHFEMLSINYCPMCGRDLRQEG